MSTDGYHSPREPHLLFTPRQTNPLPLPGPGYFVHMAEFETIRSNTRIRSNFAVFGDYNKPRAVDAEYNGEDDEIRNEGDEYPFQLDLPVSGTIAQRRILRAGRQVDEVRREQQLRMHNQDENGNGPEQNWDDLFPPAGRDGKSKIKDDASVSPKAGSSAQTGRDEVSRQSHVRFVRTEALTKIRAGTARRKLRSPPPQSSTYLARSECNRGKQLITSAICKDSRDKDDQV